MSLRLGMGLSRKRVVGGGNCTVEKLKKDAETGFPDHGRIQMERIDEGENSEGDNIKARQKRSRGRFHGIADFTGVCTQGKVAIEPFPLPKTGE